jgi:hypothetical protein
LVAKVLAMLQIVKVKISAKAKVRHSSKIILQSQPVLSLLAQARLLQVLNLAAVNHQVKSAHLRK